MPSTGACTSRRACRRPHSRRPGTSSPATSRWSAPDATCSRSISPAACREPARARAKRPGWRPRPGTPGTRGGARRTDRRRRPGLPGAGRGARRPSGAPIWTTIVAAVGRSTREPGHLVLPGHARVPAPGRTHRRGAGDGRNRAQGQADPHVRHGDRPRRTRAHARASLRADGRLPARAAGARRDRLDRAARAVARRRRAAGRAGPRDLRLRAAVLHRRSGPCSARTWARECSSAA